MNDDDNDNFQLPQEFDCIIIYFVRTVYPDEIATSMFYVASAIMMTVFRIWSPNFSISE